MPFASTLQEPPRPGVSLERSAARILLRRWHSEIPSEGALPTYENVALGSLGRCADGSALVGEDRQGNLKILRIGPSFSDWVGAGREAETLDQLSPARSRTIGEVIERARANRNPQRVETHRVIDGSIVTYDLWALPLAIRWYEMAFVLVLDERDGRADLLETMFGATSDGMIALETITSPSGEAIDFQVMALNDSAAKLLSLDRSQLLWHRLSDISGVFAGSDPIAEIADAVAKGERKVFEAAAITGDEAPRHLRFGVAPVGSLVSLTLTDIADIRAREDVLRTLFDDNPVPTWLADRESLAILRANDAALQHYGHGREAFLKMTVADLAPPEHRAKVRATLRGLDPSCQGETSWINRKADDTVIEVFPYARIIEVERRAAILISVIDVTERRKAEARIEHLAHHDTLTDLPNRSLFRIRLEDSIEAARRAKGRLAVFCLDLDHFKSVNDTLGHPIGDKLLQAVADRFRQSLCEWDFIARLGGDEFALVTSAAAEPAQAARLAERLIETVDRPYDIHGHQVVIGTSIGIAFYPDDGTEPDVLLKRADVALYRAKNDGRNLHRFFEPEMDRRLQARRLLELDMRRALIEQSFELFYQPLVNVGTRSVTGFEALLRWRDPVRGMIPPGDFVPLAEEVGLIIPIGEWVLRQACAEAANWPAPLRVAVNLSPVQFRSDYLVDAVRRALAESGLAPQRLELEITESVLLQGNERNLAILKELKSLGIRISMDDFGTGYSSLGYLQRFPFDKIKIDQSFVRELSERPESMAIIRAVMGIGRSLQMTTTAEGVETPEQMERLRREGCDEAQGFLFSRPVPAWDLPSVMASLLADLARDVGEGAERVLEPVDHAATQ
ncbi:putative bifunctional diguanylate cyclase/phosphodiesterase [Consotaella salsifontis]|uniref:PAS domain S-box-containing protein/diguanylate cyclase (GGDEF) domain-containing protein n=1 Tax=Consotaella salsifontis TaxID=1365950 RepID=A0A1T4QUD9_9HYPH|nr:EAL domain-containing protein [Consotaella salsifontis]SKA06898.1 PAS domain S-box-containing protein/diguanylate cyclase (GGDEF) domain-containing protein [Consotaella salsifontis]